MMFSEYMDKLQLLEKQLLDAYEEKALKLRAIDEERQQLLDRLLENGDRLRAVDREMEGKCAAIRADIDRLNEEYKGKEDDHE